MHFGSKAPNLCLFIHPSRFCGNLFSGFCVTLLTNKQTNKQICVISKIYPPPWRCQKQKSGSADGIINLRDGEGAAGFQVDPGCV